MGPTNEHPRISRPASAATGARANRLRPATPKPEIWIADLNREPPASCNEKSATFPVKTLSPQPEHCAPFYWDVETRSAAKLGKGKEGVGARAYAEHPSTAVWCVSFARGNGPVETWIPPDPIPEAVLAAAADPRCPWVAHNAAFERAILEVHPDPVARLADGAGQSACLHDVPGTRASLSRQPRGCC